MGFFNNIPAGNVQDIDYKDILWNGFDNKGLAGRFNENTIYRTIIPYKDKRIKKFRCDSEEILFRVRLEVFLTTEDKIRYNRKKSCHDCPFFHAHHGMRQTQGVKGGNCKLGEMTPWGYICPTDIVFGGIRFEKVK